MRKIVLTLVAILVAFAFTAFAQSQLEVWKWIDGAWVSISDGPEDVQADAWAFSLGGAEGRCNKHGRSTQRLRSRSLSGSISR
jgi:hypothetical protein